MKKTLICAALIVIVLAMFIIYIMYLHVTKLPTAFVANNMTYRFTSYAYTQSQRQQGLMNATVTNSTIMLFIFGTPGVYPFWMKDTYASLDIMWINYSTSTEVGRVVYIVNASPCADYDSSQVSCIIYTPTSKANYVIEAKSGFAERNGISVGTEVQMLYK